MKTSTTIRILLFLSVLFVLSSCAPVYLPNTVNMALPGEKGDVKVSAYTGFSGYDLQASVAPTEHIVVTLNGSYVDWSSDSTRSKRQHGFIEAGAGIYTKMGTKGRVSLVGGYGFGKINAIYDNNLFNDDLKVNNSRIFLQPTIGVESDVFEAAFASRFAHVLIFQGKNSESQFFIEPAIALKLGFKYLKFVTQIGVSIPVGNLNIHYQPFIGSIGMEANIGELFRK